MEHSENSFFDHFVRAVGATITDEELENLQAIPVPIVTPTASVALETFSDTIALETSRAGDNEGNGNNTVIDTGQTNK